jgi:uncharacterized membrane protein
MTRKTPPCRRWLPALILAAALAQAALAAAPAAPADEGPGERAARWLSTHGIPPDLAVVLIATLPIVELRGAIPVAMHVFDMSIPRSFLLSVAGNMLPIPFIILLLEPLSRLLRRWAPLARLMDWLFERTRRKSETIRRYQELGLIIFIAIPLPATGAWTGAMAAFLFGLKFWPSFFCALAGVCIAGVIVTTFSAFGVGGAIAAGIVLSAATAVSLLRRPKES